MNKLTENEKNIVLQCLKACIGEVFFPDWEFHTLTGYEKDEVKHLIVNWPKANFEDLDTRNLVLNVLNNLLGYPHKVSNRQWETHITASPEEIDKLWGKISGESTGSYFERLI
jgi:hypothetical protein